LQEGNPSETAFGDSMKVAAEKLANSPQVIAFGINCCMPADVESFLKQVKEYKTSRTLKTIIYPNSGQQWIRGQG
jgi:S-methylmethionine-dependent homocysteine/selenocysteine methylase